MVRRNPISIFIILVLLSSTLFGCPPDRDSSANGSIVADLDGDDGGNSGNGGGGNNDDDGDGDGDDDQGGGGSLSCNEDLSSGGATGSQSTFYRHIDGESEDAHLGAFGTAIIGDTSSIYPIVVVAGNERIAAINSLNNQELWSLLPGQTQNNGSESCTLDYDTVEMRFRVLHIAAVDVDGFGGKDLVVGDRYYSDSGQFCIFNKDGELLEQVADTTGEFGWFVADAGNIDGIQGNEIAVTRYLGTSGPGSVKIFNQAGIEIDSLPGPAGSFHSFGHGVTPDPSNGDLLVGNPLHNGTGVVYRFRKNQQSGFFEVVDTLVGPSNVRKFGHDIAMCDFDGDGIKEDFIIGAPPTQEHQLTNRGMVFAYDGTCGELLFTLTGRAPDASTWATGFGEGVSCADVNGDGRDDIIAGDAQYSGDASESLGIGGYVKVFSGVDGSQIFEHVETGTSYCEFSQGYFYHLPAKFGRNTLGHDFDLDGYADILATAANFEGAGGACSGRVRAFSTLAAIP